MFSFWFLSRAIVTLPIGAAYAVCVGIGAVGATVTSVLIYGEPAGLARMSFIGLLIFSIIGLKIVSDRLEIHDRSDPPRNRLRA